MAYSISIISGKGGSGKSLLTATLGRAIAREGKNVLLVDFDIFVRGLTIMLFSYQKPSKDGDSYTTSDLLGVFEKERNKKQPDDYYKKGFYIQRFFECDVLPSVRNISHPLDYSDRDLGDKDFCKKVLDKLIKEMKGKYDYILIDCRAGMDSLVAAACEASDFVLSITEDDEISRQTNANVTKFLQYKQSVSTIFNVLNKARSIKSYHDIKERFKQREEFSTLGVIPFDIDIMEDFGSNKFWTTITETLYFRALIDVWNNLSKFESIQEISLSKYKFPPKIFMNPSQGRFSSGERILRLYSVTFIMVGIFSWIYGKYRFENLSTLDLISIISIGVGVLALIFSTSGFKNFLKFTKEK